MEEKQKYKVTNFWKDGSRETLKLARDVLKKGYHDHALFCAHLALEKLLKAFVIEVSNKHTPRSHDLLYLAGLAKIDMDIDQQKFLVEVNSFNIEGRYPEERLEFYHQITRKFALEQLKKIEEFYLWLLKQNRQS